MKDYLRDYATEAFRFYARCGRPTYEEMRAAIYNAALESTKRELVRTKGISNPTQQAVMRAEEAVDAMNGQLLDILAVECAFKIMRPEWRRAVEVVYFVNPDGELNRGDIECRVQCAESNLPASRRNIYYWLKQARAVFSLERGLRI